MLIRGNARNLRRVDGSKTLEQRALSVIRSLGGDAIYVQNGFPRLWTDSAGTTPVTAVGDAVGRVVGRTGVITATQATTANKPLVSSPAAGRLAMSFDGVNDNLLTNITTGNEGWVCSGVTFGAADSAVETVFHSGAHSVPIKGIWIARVGSVSVNAMWCAVSNGTTRAIGSVSAVPLKSGSAVVVEGGWSANLVFCGVNGVMGLTSNRTGDATPPTNLATIGIAVGGSYLGGPITSQVYTPVLPSLPQRQLILRWVGSLQGQTL